MNTPHRVPPLAHAPHDGGDIMRKFAEPHTIPDGPGYTASPAVPHTPGRLSPHARAYGAHWGRAHPHHVLLYKGRGVVSSESFEPTARCQWRVNDNRFFE